MASNEQTIINLENDLAALASSIADDSLSLANTVAAIEEANDEIETRRAAMMSAIFSERFEINLKQKYTNDEQRKVRLIEMQNADVSFQNFRSVRTTLAAASAQQKANIEKNRNLHKAKLPVLQYYANLP